MEVKKINCFMPVLIVSYVFLSSLVSLLMVVAINQLGIHIPGWVSYVISETVIIVIGLIYIAVMGISIKRDMQYHIIAFKDVIVSILAGYMMIPMVLFINNVQCFFQRIILKRHHRHCLHIHLWYRLYLWQLYQHLLKNSYSEACFMERIENAEY